MCLIERVLQLRKGARRGLHTQNGDTTAPPLALLLPLGRSPRAECTVTRSRAAARRRGSSKTSLTVGGGWLRPAELAATAAASREPPLEERRPAFDEGLAAKFASLSSALLGWVVAKAPRVRAA